MHFYGGPQTSITTALPGGLPLAIIMDRYLGPQTALTIYNLAWRPPTSHYNRPLWRIPNCPYNRFAGGLYLTIIMDLNGGPQNALTIALSGGL
jgi:hypothetical protein